jgi:hypothetical protein
LNDRGVQLYHQGQPLAAIALLEQALGMHKRLYSADRYPEGHPLLVLGLKNLASVLENPWPPPPRRRP